MPDAANGCIQELTDWIRALRRELRLTQGQLAKRLGVTRVTIARWENGRVRPSQLALRSLSGIAEVTYSPRFSASLAKLSGSQEPQSAARASSVIPSLGSPAESEAAVACPLNEPPLSPMGAQDEIADTLRRSPVFADLNRDEFAALSRLATERRLKAGEFLFHEGDRVESFYVVVAGRVKVLRHSLSGRDFIMSFIGPGEMMGNTLLSSRNPQASSTQAATDTKIVVINNHEFVSFVTRNPELGLKMLRRMLDVVGTRLVKALVRLTDIAAERADYRLSNALLTLSLQFGTSLAITHAEIAQMAGTTTETATRFLSRLRRAGILDCIRGRIIILDKSRLWQMHSQSLTTR